MIASIAIGAEATVSKPETTPRPDQTAPTLSPSAAPRIAQAEMIAYTATNLYTLMAWLYDKPKM